MSGTNTPSSDPYSACRTAVQTSSTSGLSAHSTIPCATASWRAPEIAVLSHPGYDCIPSTGPPCSPMLESFTPRFVFATKSV